MTEDSHAAQAREHLTRLDVDGDPELEALRTEAVAAVDTLLARLRTANAEETEPDTSDAPGSWDNGSETRRSTPPGSRPGFPTRRAHSPRRPSTATSTIISSGARATR